MHKLASTPINQDCFELNDFNQNIYLNNIDFGLKVVQFVESLELLRNKYLETKDQKYWKELVRWLPQGWLQTRTVTMNYEVLTNIYSQRKNHRLTEWHAFCDWVKTLPYSFELITFNIDKE